MDADRRPDDMDADRRPDDMDADRRPDDMDADRRPDDMDADRRPEEKAVDRLTLILDALSREGQRVTVGRRAVVEALLEAEGHLSADDLAGIVQSAHHGLHRATVYRSLEALEAAGLVEHVHLGHGRSVYHLADDLHQHLVCEVCGSVEEAPADLLSAVARRLRRQRGFVMRPYHFAVLGRCRSCSDDGGGAIRHRASGRSGQGRAGGTVIQS